MSATAPPVDVGTSAPGHSTDPWSDRGVVSVYPLGLANTTARCSCGWVGGRRLLKAAAEQDAWAHSVRDGCDVSSPLVLTW